MFIVWPLSVCLSFLLALFCFADLFGNPLSQEYDYRSYVIHHVPSVELLDRKGNEVELPIMLLSVWLEKKGEGMKKGGQNKWQLGILCQFSAYMWFVRWKMKSVFTFFHPFLILRSQKGRERPSAEEVRAWTRIREGYGGFWPLCFWSTQEGLPTSSIKNVWKSTVGKRCGTKNCPRSLKQPRSRLKSAHVRKKLFNFMKT